MYCTNDKICNICAGELYGEDMLDIKDWGLLFYKVGTSIMYESMKGFHDSTVSLEEIKIEDWID
jgi:hypothetical protein